MSTNMDNAAFAENVDEVFCDLLMRGGTIVGPSPTVVVPSIEGITEFPHTLFVAVQREEALLGMLVDRCRHFDLGLGVLCLVSQHGDAVVDDDVHSPVVQHADGLGEPVDGLNLCARLPRRLGPESRSTHRGG